MQLLVLPLAVWVVWAFIAPARVASVLPPRDRRPGTAGPWIIGGVGAGWLLVGALWGWSLAIPGDTAASRWTLALTAGSLLGLPAALVTVKVWRAALSLPVADGRAAWSGPALSSVTLAARVLDPTPRPRVAMAPLTYPRRRRVAFALGVAGLLVLLASVSLSAAASAQVPGASPLPLAIIVAGAAGVMYVYRGQARSRTREGRRGPPVDAVVAANGWRLSHDEDDGLPRAFPGAPFLRPVGDGDSVRQLRTVTALSGARHWWVCEQRGHVRSGNGRQFERVQSVWLVWLPGARLGRVMVTGREEADRRVSLLTRFGPSITLESYAFNQRLLAVAPPGQEAQATGILHPRMMELLMAELPDDSLLLIAHDHVCLWRSGPLHGGPLASHASLVLAVADLIPCYLLSATDSRG